MAAHVVEAAQCTVTVADKKQRHAGMIDAQEIAGLGDLGARGDRRPRFAEELAALAREPAGIGIGAVRQACAHEVSAFILLSAASTDATEATTPNNPPSTVIMWSAPRCASASPEPHASDTSRHS